MREERCDKAHDDIEAERAKTTQGVDGPNDSISVIVEEVAVLLQDGLVRMLLGPFRCAVRGFCAGSSIRPSCAWSSHISKHIIMKAETYCTWIRKLSALGEPRIEDGALYGDRNLQNSRLQ